MIRSKTGPNTETSFHVSISLFPKRGTRPWYKEMLISKKGSRFTKKRSHFPKRDHVSQKREHFLRIEECLLTKGECIIVKRDYVSLKRLIFLRIGEYYLFKWDHVFSIWKQCFKIREHVLIKGVHVLLTRK